MYAEWTKYCIIERRKKTTKREARKKPSIYTRLVVVINIRAGNKEGEKPAMGIG